MKKSWLLLTISFCCLSLQAQFYTIAYSKPLYKLQEVAEPTETKSLPENGEADNLVSLISMAGKQSEEMRSHWIGCYMSVSYPLKKIIVTSPYGRRKDPFTGKRRSHNGLDLRARNEEVYAMMPGKVVKVSSDKRSGKYVTIRHGDYIVSYCHLSKALVKKGAKVLPGEVVAISGNTGRSTGPHLHITAKYGKKHIDPAILLQLVKETREEALAHLSGS
ncbi:MAG: M23 family metallopeptidase [Candidatus Bacteroides intestinipullorum]|uniref:M23 family metallopeptidase n=1 Tax=Candidatus Bacteroides intestinipullorum TaxID=2838471 RepID=A0A9E2KEH2_9BACE|nr:M23 family metallopeptidase [Candidatus Bacteroides intestinipullorum]